MLIVAQWRSPNLNITVANKRSMVEKRGHVILSTIKITVASEYLSISKHFIKVSLSYRLSMDFINYRV